MYEFIQALPNNPMFVLALIAVFAFIWVNPPKKVFWKQHIVGNFDESGHHPACFDCNDSGESCYKNLERCAAMREKPFK